MYRVYLLLVILEPGSGNEYNHVYLGFRAQLRFRDSKILGKHVVGGIIPKL